MRERDVIHLRGMEFYGYHGVFSEEKTLGQRFIIDVDLYTDFSQASSTDNLQYALDYGNVYQIIKNIVETQHFDLIETLAESIAIKVLGDTPCRALRIEVHKPSAPIPGAFKDVSVEIYREN